MSTYKFLAAIVLCMISIGSACATSITLASLPENSNSRTIAFESVTPRHIKDFVERTVDNKASITGRLTFPEVMTSPVPAVIILHGSSGVNPGELVWAQRLNSMGFASFVIDSFTGRGVTKSALNNSVFNEQS